MNVGEEKVEKAANCILGEAVTASGSQGDFNCSIELGSEEQAIPLENLTISTNNDEIGGCAELTKEEASPKATDDAISNSGSAESELAVTVDYYVAENKNKKPPLTPEVTIPSTRLMVHYDAMGPWSRFVKRTADILFSLCGLLLLSPVFLVITIALLFQRNGKVFFSQERIGYHGKPFRIYKFRTMSSMVEDEGPQLVAKSDIESTTRLERFLREHHLDELPQLWNVLTGDMSMVGPRPERKYFIDQIMEHTHDYELIYEMRPGLTSEATLYNGYTDTMEKMLKRLEMDLEYLEHRSWWLDIKIVFLTFVNIVFGKKF